MISQIRRWAADQQFAWKRRQLDRRDPEVEFPVIPDLAAEAVKRGWVLEKKAPAAIQRTAGGFCLSEDFVYWVKGGEQRLRKHRDWKRNPAVPWDWISTLHATRRYAVPETFACAIPGGLVYQRGGAAFTPERELIAESHFLTWRPRTGEWKAAVPRKLPGRVINFAMAYANTSISHFMMDSAIRATFFEDFSDVTCLATPDFRPWHYGTFELLGIRPEQFVFTDTLLTECEELVLCKSADHSVLPHGDHLRTMRQRMVRNAGGNESVPPRRRLYISRAKDPRHLVNEDELWPLLAERGFEKVYCQDHSMKENVRLFSQAEAVAGLHGSGFINTIFAPPGAKIIELHNPFMWDASASSYAQLSGHECWHGFGEDAGGPFSTRFERKKLARLLDFVFDGPSVDIIPT